MTPIYIHNGEPRKIVEPEKETFMPDQSERDWKEDFSHENGKYQNECGKCHQLFYGHKRRVRCKVCQEEPAQPEAPKEDYELHSYHGQLTLVLNGDKICLFTKEGSEIAKSIKDDLNQRSQQELQDAYSNGMMAERILCKALIAELWSLWEDLAEAGQLTVGEKYSANYERLKKEVAKMTT